MFKSFLVVQASTGKDVAVFRSPVTVEEYERVTESRDKDNRVVVKAEDRAHALEVVIAIANLRLIEL